MADKPKSAFTEFLKSMGVLLVFPIMPLLFEFLCTISRAPKADQYLERTSVLLTASILAAGVGIASKFKPIFGFCLVIGVCLAVMYGNAQAGSRIEATKAAQQEAANPSVPQITNSAPNRANQRENRQRTFWDKLDMDDFAGRAAWSMMFAVSVLLIIERLFRHVLYKEPYKFDWSD